MVDFLNDDVEFHGEVASKSEWAAEGGITIGEGGMSYGRPPSELVNTWGAIVRVRVANITERNAVVAWRQANDPISAVRPLFVWRADGAYYSGLDEMTIDGNFWTAQSAMAGDIEPTISSIVPTGWVLMEGQLVTNAQTNFPALWAMAHPSLRVGSDIRIPDMRGRVPMGAGAGNPGLTLRNIGDQMGSEQQTLSVANLPAHNHTGLTNGADRSLNHRHNVGFNNLLGNNPAGDDFNFKIAGSGNPVTSTYVLDTSDPNTDQALNHKHSFTTNNTGSGTAHNNIQPSTVINFKVKL